MSRTITSIDPVRGFLMLASTIAILASPIAASADDITIRVSPNVINLSSEGEIVTVNTDLPYSDVDGASVVIANSDGTVTRAISWWKSDNRGEFVAKVTMESVQQLGLEPGTDFHLFVHITMTDGSVRTGSAAIKVIDQQGR